MGIFKNEFLFERFRTLEELADFCHKKGFGRQNIISITVNNGLYELLYIK